jgi:hypothetical protein
MMSTMDRPDEPRGSQPVVNLSEEECWDFLRTQEVGRLAVSVAGVPDIFPIQFLVDRHTLIFRTEPGTQLLELSANQYVAFEADSWNVAEPTSVVVRGHAALVEDSAERDRTGDLNGRASIPGSNAVSVRIQPATITGRRSHLRRPAER